MRLQPAPTQTPAEQRGGQPTRAAALEAGGEGPLTLGGLGDLEQLLHSGWRDDQRMQDAPELHVWTLNTTQTIRMEQNFILRTRSVTTQRKALWPLSPNASSPLMN